MLHINSFTTKIRYDYQRHLVVSAGSSSLAGCYSLWRLVRGRPLFVHSRKRVQNYTETWFSNFHAPFRLSKSMFLLAHFWMAHGANNRENIKDQSFLGNPFVRRTTSMRISLCFLVVPFERRTCRFCNRKCTRSSQTISALELSHTFAIEMGEWLPDNHHSTRPRRDRSLQGLRFALFQDYRSVLGISCLGVW